MIRFNLDARGFAAGLIAFLCCALAACAPSEDERSASPAVGSSPAAGIVIETPQVSGLLFLPAASEPQPAVLVIGGSEGGLKASGKLAEALADAGLAALAVAYFDHPGLPRQLIEIPLERFDHALDWLRNDPRVRGERIAILGASKGAEAALLVAAAQREIAAVVVGSPSHVVWQAIDQQGWSNRSSWSRDGVPLAWVPYDMHGPMWPLVQMYARSLDASEAVAPALIPVAAITAPVLLVSGDDDQLWPSTPMGQSLAAALRAAGNAGVVHHHYAAAGHAAFGIPFDPSKVDRAGVEQLGGTLEGNTAARSDSWPRIIGFLQQALGVDAPNASNALVAAQAGAR
jgi:dienelactone hydrolase